MRKLDSTVQQRVSTNHILSLLRRLRLDWLLQHFPPRLVRSIYVFVNGFITIAVLALLALLSRTHLCFLLSDQQLIYYSFLPSAKPQVREILFSATPSGLSVGMRHLFSQGPERNPSGPIKEYSGHESWQRLFRFR